MEPMSVLTAVLYLVLAFLLGTTVVSLARQVPVSAGLRGRAHGSRASASDVLLSVVVCGLCVWLVPDLRPEGWGDAWHLTWIDAVPVLAGVVWALLPERELAK